MIDHKLLSIGGFNAAIMRLAYSVLTFPRNCRLYFEINPDTIKD